MKHFAGSIKKLILCGLSAFSIIGASLGLPMTAFADDTTQGFSMSPMKENMILNPGETYQSSFTIFNPATNPTNFSYEINISPFFVDENYQNIFSAEGSYSEITEWITINSPLTGTLTPNQQEEIYFTVNVPSDAPAGGQYAAIIVSSADPTTFGEDSAIIERTAIAHTIFAEITGATVHKGDVTDVSVPSFLLSGEISGESTIKNTGNVHGRATYKLTVNSISGEELYSNVDNPETHDVLPGRTYYHKTSWENTPAIGIFNVIYSVDFDGVVTDVTSTVIICPIWLMLVIVGVIALIVGFIIVKIKKH